MWVRALSYLLSPEFSVMPLACPPSSSLGHSLALTWALFCLQVSTQAIPSGKNTLFVNMEDIQGLRIMVKTC